MLAPWAMEEMKTVDLNDKRLNNRISEVLSLLAAHPTASIPAACGGYAETAAAYRLFDNEKVHFENVLQPHIEATRQRIAVQPVVILPQDTTEIDLTRPQQQVVGAGPLDGGARRGVPCGPSGDAAKDASQTGRNGAHGGPTGRLREPETPRRAWFANRLVWPATRARQGPLLATVRPGGRKRRNTCVEQRGVFTRG